MCNHLRMMSPLIAWEFQLEPRSGVLPIMSARLIESLATTPALAELFSDESVLRAMLDFEAALARAEARLGIIPTNAADAITNSAKPGNFDGPALADATFRAGTPAIPLVKALTEQVRKNERRGGAIRALGSDQPGCGG